MIKEIKYTGFTAVPSDYECPDGDLAMAMNLLPEHGGSISRIAPPSVILSMDAPSRVEHIHSSSAFTHYIIVNPESGEISWADSSDIDKDSLKPSVLTPLRTLSGGVYRIDSIGNTLLLLASDGMHYFLWKGNKDGYLYLGTHLPECPISFGLQGEMTRGEEFVIKWDSYIWIGYQKRDEFLLTDKNRKQITDLVIPHVNKFIAENSVNSGKFMFPFFVRYAFRLYDGSLTMHSAPVLMAASSDLAPQCIFNVVKDFFDYGAFTSAKLRLAAMFHQLDYAAGSIAVANLSKWSDIIKSVDIFISKPIYTYDQNGECPKFISTDISDSYSVCRHVNRHESLLAQYPPRYQKSNFMELYAMTFEPESLSAPGWRLMLPRRDADAIKADIEGNSLFYLLKSINIEDLKTERTLIPVNKEHLQSLLAREVMTDDYNSHDLVIPRYSYAYNSRLSIANLRSRLFSGYHASSAFPFTDGCVHSYDDAASGSLDSTIQVQVFYVIKRDGKEIVTEGEAAPFGFETPFLWLFYPDSNACKAILSIRNFVSGNLYEVQLEPHPTLNGAYWFGGWDGLNTPSHAYSGNIPVPTSPEGRTIEMPNKIYTSEINNPFFFPLLGINTVGAGKIIGMASAAKALSQGQFGQFPLYAFTSDGVWAMEVSSQGSFSARQPITRDVCVNPGSITQIDSAVLFATGRGIMLISGSQTQCISEPLNSDTPFDVLPLPGMDKLHDMLPHNGDSCLAISPFSLFMSSCAMIYDYVHQRIILFSPSHSYAYAYSLKSKQWGMMQSNLAKPLNSYPEALAVDNAGNLIDFSKESGETIPGLIVTRPITLGDADMLKTIDTLIQRGNFRSGHVKTALYGSRDLFNWHLVSSSVTHRILNRRGTPYKYFRIAVVCGLEAGESVSGCSVSFTPRLTNRLR